MSVLYETNACSLIDHREYVLQIYKDAEIDNKLKFSYALQGQLFCIKTKEKVLSRKRIHDSERALEDTISIKYTYETFKSQIPRDILLNISKKYNIKETAEVRALSQQLFENTVFDLDGINGGNNSDKFLRCIIKNEEYLIPPHSRFFCGDVKEQCNKLKGNKFDIVIVDPPWWNKYIRRLKSANDKLSYKMMYNKDIASIPIKDLLSENCLIAVWCTNAPSTISAVKDLIFPSWGIEYLTTWYWLKVSIDLEPLCDFGTGCKKQPYERLILGKVGNIKDVHEKKLIVSVPSSLHSHKPPLLDILKPYVGEEPQVLELFARYLMPSTTSVGHEPLKWQHISLYEKVS